MEDRVRVAHFRIPRGYTETAALRYFRGSGFAAKGYNGKPDERGGLTMASIRVDASGERAVALAECSVKDSYCYRIGREIAVGRLRKKIKELGYSVNADGTVRAL